MMNRLGQIQPTLITFGGGRVAAITRDGTHSFRIHRMDSSNSGKKWEEMRLLGLPNAGTSVDWVRLRDGDIVVVFNNSYKDRFPLSVALSKDEGYTFIALADIDAECETGGNCSYAYPSIMQDRIDDSIWVSYSHNRDTIGYVHFNKAWLIGQKNKSNLSCMPAFECVDNVCLKKCSNLSDCEKGQECDTYCIKKCNNDSDCQIKEFCSTKKICLPLYDPERVDEGCR